MIKGLVVLVLVAVLSPVCMGGTTKCRAVVFSGGGDKGAYEMGVLKAMIENLPPEEVQWDVVSGVSAGALNSALVSRYPKGKEKEMLQFGLDLWHNVKPTQIYKNWPFGILDGLFYKAGILDDTPLLEFFRSIYKGSFPQRKINSASVDANTGWYHRWTESEWFNKSSEDYFRSVLASASIPTIFPYVNYYNHTLIDGGTMINLDVGGAIERCKEIVTDQKDIIIDIVLCGGASWVPIDASKDHTIDMIYRMQDLNAYRKALDDLIHELSDYPLIKFRHIVWPSQQLPGGIHLLDFDPKELAFMIELGEKDCKKQMQAGSESNIETLKQLRKSLKAPRKYVTANLPTEKSSA